MLSSQHIVTAEPGNLYRVDADSVGECLKFVKDFLDEKMTVGNSRRDKSGDDEAVFVSNILHSSATRRHGMPQTSAVIFSFDEVEIGQMTARRG